MHCFRLFACSLVHLLPSPLGLFSQILDLVSRADLEAEVLEKLTELLQSFLLLLYLLYLLLAESDFKLSLSHHIKQVIEPVLSEVP